jgi:hypothetical protein
LWTSKGTSTDARPAGNTKSAFGGAGLRELHALQRLIEIHRIDDDDLVVPGVAARGTHAKWNLDALQLAHVHVDLGARLLRFAFDQTLDELRLHVDPQFERTPAVGRDPDHVEVGAIRAGAFLVRYARGRAVRIPEREDGRGTKR